MIKNFWHEMLAFFGIHSEFTNSYYVEAPGFDGHCRMITDVRCNDCNYKRRL